MPYIIKCWIPVDEEDPQMYDAEYNAQSELEQIEDMQPENRYEIVECDKQGKEIQIVKYKGIVGLALPCGSTVEVPLRGLQTFRLGLFYPKKHK